MCKTCGCKDAETFGADSKKCPKCDAGNLGKEEMYYCYTCGNDNASEDGCSKCGSDAVGEEEMDYCYNCGEQGHWFNAESFGAEEWDFGNDREALRNSDENSDFNSAWRMVFRTKRRDWPSWGQKFYDKYKWTLDDSTWNPYVKGGDLEDEEEPKGFRNAESFEAEKIDTFSEIENEWKDSSVTIYDEDADEFYGIKEILVQEGDDVLEDGHPYLVLNKDSGDLDSQVVYRDFQTGYDAESFEAYGHKGLIKLYGISGDAKIQSTVERILADINEGQGFADDEYYYLTEEERDEAYDGMEFDAESFEAHDHSHIYPFEELTHSQSHSSETFKSSNNNNNTMAAESKFDKLSDKIAKQYRKKGMSAKEAKEIGNKTAYTIGRKKYGKAGMAKKARAGMRAESFGAEVAYAVMWEGKEDDNEGLIYGIEYMDGDEVSDVEWFSTKEKRDGELKSYIKEFGKKAESFEADDDYVIVDRGNYRVRVHKKNLDRFNRSTMHKIHSDKNKEGLMYDEETSRWIPLEAESFGAEGNPNKTTTSINPKFFVGKGDGDDLRGKGKFMKYNDALAKAQEVAEKEGKSRVVNNRGFALWTHDGQGLFQKGKSTTQAKKYYRAEEYSIGSGFRLGFGLGLGMLALSTVTTIAALAASTIDERQVE